MDAPYRPRRRASTFLPRLLLATLLATAVFMPSLYQPGLSAVYRWLYYSDLYRFSGFETLLTIACYIIFEPLYTYKFGHNPHLRIDVRQQEHRLPKMRRPQHRLGELAIYVAPLLLLDLTMVKKFAGVPLNDIRHSGGYAPIVAAPPSANISSSTAASASFLLPTLHNFSLASPLQLHRALPPIAPTSRRIALELMAAFFIYDGLFFALHVALHYIPPLARIHKPHHTHAAIHPQITNRLSVTERLSLVMLANFALNIIGSHVLTRTCFVPLFVYLLIEVHCGMDLDWGYDKLLPLGWGSGPAVHAHHHRSGRGAYAPFFQWWDAAFAWCIKFSSLGQGNADWGLEIIAT